MNATQVKQLKSGSVLIKDGIQCRVVRVETDGRVRIVDTDQSFSRITSEEAMQYTQLQPGVVLEKEGIQYRVVQVDNGGIIHIVNIHLPDADRVPERIIPNQAIKFKVVSEPIAPIAITYSVTVAVDEQRIKNLLCGAFEGGSNYWIKCVNPVPKAERNPGVEFYYESPLYGQPFTIECSEDAPDGKQTVTLDKDGIVRGLQVMAEKYPKHFSDFVAETDDATTSDVFLQCCVFGDAIYG